MCVPTVIYCLLCCVWSSRRSSWRVVSSAATLVLAAHLFALRVYQLYLPESRRLCGQAISGVLICKSQLYASTALVVNMLVYSGIGSLFYRGIGSGIGMHTGIKCTRTTLIRTVETKSDVASFMPFPSDSCGATSVQLSRRTPCHSQSQIALHLFLFGDPLLRSDQELSMGDSSRSTPCRSRWRFDSSCRTCAFIS